MFRWWDDFSLALGRYLEYDIGQLNLLLSGRQSDWTLAWRYDLSIADAADRFQMQSHTSQPGELENHSIQRIARPDTAKPIVLKPALADRGVVARPSHPLWIAPQDQILMYVSTPLWVTLGAPDTQDFYFDRPAQLLSDTWFGPDTQSGELCYFTQTEGSLDLADVPQRQNRVITPVQIHNLRPQPFLLERINVPMPFLSIMMANNGQLWTEQVCVRCLDTTVNPVDVAIAARHASPVSELKEIAPPRKKHARDHLSTVMALILD
jgi:hypothetical protein